MVPVHRCICLTTAPVPHGSPPGSGAAKVQSMGRSERRALAARTCFGGLHSRTGLVLEVALLPGALCCLPSSLFVRRGSAVWPWAFLLRVSLGVGHGVRCLTLQTLLG